MMQQTSLSCDGKPNVEFDGVLLDEVRSDKDCEGCVLAEFNREVIKRLYLTVGKHYVLECIECRGTQTRRTVEVFLDRFELIDRLLYNSETAGHVKLGEELLDKSGIVVHDDAFVEFVD
jgi:hypothetical protein